MSSNKSFIDYAYDVLKASKQPLTFKEIFERACELGEIKISQSELTSRISSFYTQLSTDGRFTLLEDKKWDLVARYAYDDVHKKDEFEDDDEDIEEDEEEKELLKAELGEEEEREDSDELDFDKPEKESDEF
jgi:DNA-directed RNA polymerase subunit delta